MTIGRLSSPPPRKSVSFYANYVSLTGEANLWFTVFVHLVGAAIAGSSLSRVINFRFGLSTWRANAISTLFHSKNDTFHR